MKLYDGREIFFFVEMCSSRKYPYLPHGRSMEIPRGRGVAKEKVLEEKYGAKLECAVTENIHTSPMEGQWKFPGGEWGQKEKFFKEKYGAKLKFPEMYKPINLP